MASKEIATDDGISASVSDQQGARTLMAQQDYIKVLGRYSRWVYLTNLPPLVGQFPLLQMQNITHLTNELAKLQSGLQQEVFTISHARDPVMVTQEAEALTRKLHEYAEAIRDLEYMNRLPRMPTGAKRFHWKVTRDAFPEIYPDNQTFVGTEWLTVLDSDQRRRDALLSLVPFWLHDFLLSIFKKRNPRHEPDRFNTDPDGLNANMNRFADYMLAATLAIVCGASLIVPMVIMALNPSLTKSLVTTSVSVVAFGFVLAVVDRNNVMSLTSAYAAVLVVFVGLGGTP